jgi:hypothetical protein
MFSITYRAPFPFLFHSVPIPYRKGLPEFVSQVE